MYVCMYVCMHVCMYVFMYVCMHVMSCHVISYHIICIQLYTCPWIVSHLQPSHPISPGAPRPRPRSAAAWPAARTGHCSCRAPERRGRPRPARRFLGPNVGKTAGKW